MALIIDINSVTMTEPDYLAIIKERGQGALDIKMGIEMLEVSPQRLVARMPVEGNTQPIGLLHSTSCWSRSQDCRRGYQCNSP
jgi:hypothetical protein